jgi:Domain of unknown function (DUF4150)
MFATTQMGGMSVGFPDVCTTPSMLGGAASAPYTNTAAPPMATQPTSGVLFDNAPAHNLSTVVPITNGAPLHATAGIASGTVMGSSRCMTGASTVLTDGMPATRMTSIALMNSTNCPGVTIAPSQLKVLILAR